MLATAAPLLGDGFWALETVGLVRSGDLFTFDGLFKLLGFRAPPLLLGLAAPDGVGGAWEVVFSGGVVLAANAGLGGPPFF